MPVSIGDVHSEVLVDSPPAEGNGAGDTKMLLPTQRDLERWLQMQRRQQWDDRRTLSHDFDD